MSALPQPGGQLTRTLSQSHTTPRNLGGYQAFFRQNSIPEAGWLEIRLGISEGWVKYWVVFDNAANTMSYSQSMNDIPVATIPMNHVVSFRTDSPNSLLITTTERQQIHLRANSVDELKGWLFCFQKSVALVLSQLIDGTSSTSSLSSLGGGPSSSLAAVNTSGGLARSGSLRRSYNSGSTGSLYSSDDGGVEEFVAPGQGLVQGGTQFSFARSDTKSFYPEPSSRRHSDAEFSRPFTEEDIPGILAAGVVEDSRWERSRSTQHLSRLGQDNLGSVSKTASITYGAARNFTALHSHSRASSTAIPMPNASSPVGARGAAAPMLSRSPAIPIFMGPPPTNGGDVKLAGSYVESDSEGQLEAHLGRSLDLRTRSASENPSEGFSAVESSDDDDDGVIFDLDEMHSSSAKTIAAAAGAVAPTSADGQTSRNGRSRENSSTTSRFSPAMLQAGVGGATGGSVWPLWETGTCSRLGPRSSNEDRLVALNDLREAVSFPVDAARPQEKHGFFAVYDGHCGFHASVHLHETLHGKIATHECFLTDIETAIEETCVAADREFLAICRDKRIYCGTTALGALMRANQLTVFNIGDCQAVLCSSGAAVPMSQAHQPGRPDERERITKAGGWITEERELYMGRLHRMDLSDPVVRDKAQQVNWTTIYRVCGELAVSRSIGDPDYKGFTPGEKVDAGFLWPENHAQVFNADLVIPVPEVRSKLLTPDDEFLLLASDGLWDVVSGAEAVNRTK